MKLLFFVIILFSCCQSNGQERLKLIKKEQVKIVSAKTGKTFYRKVGLNDRNSLIAAFGEPDSIEKREVETIGGTMETYHYLNDKFNYPLGNNELRAFGFESDQFMVIIRNSIKIRVGDKVDALIKLIHPDKHSEYTYLGSRGYISSFSLAYENYVNGIHYTNQRLVIIYDPETKRIIRIYDSPLS